MYLPIPYVNHIPEFWVENYEEVLVNDRIFNTLHAIN